MVTLTRWVNTCEACPSQWDAWDAEGNYYYIRYRHGWGNISSRDADVDYHFRVDGDDGYVTWEEVMEACKDVMQVNHE